MVPGGSGLPELYRSLHLDGGGVYQLEDESDLDLILNRMRHKLIQNEELASVFAAGYVYEFLIEFARQTSLRDKKRSKEGKYSLYMKELKEFISNHFMYLISLGNLCAVVAVSPQHLCRIFKESTGMRPMEYVTQVRVDMAKNLLKGLGKKVLAVAVAVGLVMPLGTNASAKAELQFTGNDKVFRLARDAKAEGLSSLEGTKHWVKIFQSYNGNEKKVIFEKDSVPNKTKAIAVKFEITSYDLDKEYEVSWYME